MERKYVYKGKKYNREELETMTLPTTLQAAKNIFYLLGEAAISMYDESDIKIIVGSPDGELDEVTTIDGEKDFISRFFRTISFKNSIILGAGKSKHIDIDTEDSLISVTLLDEILNGLSHRIYNESSGLMIDVNYVKEYRIQHKYR